MNTPHISIIIPVYNAEHQIGRCIKSILSQTYIDWEMILINDGSTDGTAEILDKYALTDNRIRIIHKANGGVSSARNAGIDSATGDYLTFVDADDHISPDYLEKMANASPADIVICGFKNSGSQPFVPREINTDSTSDPKVIAELVNIPYYLDTPWCKLFKLDIINRFGLRFNENMKLSEDTLFSYQYIAKCKTIRTVADSLYFYDGLWGGENKYNLNIQELEYISTMGIKAIREINNTFNLKIDTKYKCFHLSKLSGLFSDFKDYDIHGVYVRSHGDISLCDFLSDHQISPLTIGMLGADRLVRNGKIRECRKLLIDLLNFTSIDMRKLKFSSKKEKLFYFVLRHIGINGCINLLRLKTIM